MNNQKKIKKEVGIVGEKLKIPSDYQHRVLHSGLYFHSNWFNNKLAIMEHVIKFSKEIRVLDLGSGSGIFELKFSQQVKEIVAIDNYNPALDFLSKMLDKKSIKNVRLIKKDLRNIDKIEGLGKFDVILLLDVIEHLKSKDLALVIKTSKLLLNKDGVLCVTTPNYRSPWIILEKVWDRLHTISHLGDEQHIARFYKDNLKNLFEKFGYKTAAITTTNFLSFIIPSQKISRKISLLELNMPLFFGNLLVGIFKKTPNS